MAIALPGTMANKLTSVVALLSVATQTILAALVTRLGISSLDGSRIWGPTLTAIILDFLVLFLLVGHTAFTINARSHGQGGRYIALSIVPFVLFTTASVLSVYVLAWTWTNVASDGARAELQQAHGLTIAGLVFWTLNVVVQTAFHILSSLRKREDTKTSPAQQVTERQTTPTRSMRKRSLSIHLKSISPNSSPFSRTTTELPSPGVASYLDSSGSARSSFRHSFYQIVRPITSKTRLILAHAPSVRDSQSITATRREPSLEIACRGDGFENWDTSAVEEQFVRPMAQTGNNALKPNKLDTIPGSRPVSPAKVLDNGPFPGYTPPISPDNIPLPDSPLQSPVSPTDDADSLYCIPPAPPLRRPSSSSEAHIHPLFRSHSPTPPPTPSPGTVVTASPFAGQIVATESTGGPRRMLSVASSRPGSRGGSFKSARRPSALSQQHPADMDKAEEVPEVPRIWREASPEESSAID